MPSTNTTQTILLELDEETWNTQLDRIASWLHNVQMLQTAFRQLAEDTFPKIHEPHITQYIANIAAQAREHEQTVPELYRVFGRDPAPGRTLGGTLLSKVREVVADVEGLAGGAAGGWRDLRELLLTNVDSLGAFAVAEQLGLALGMPQVVDIIFPVIHAKWTAHLLLQEYMLEMGSKAILFKAPI